MAPQPRHFRDRQLAEAGEQQRRPDGVPVHTRSRRTGWVNAEIVLGGVQTLSVDLLGHLLADSSTAGVG